MKVVDWDSVVHYVHDGMVHAPKVFGEKMGGTNGAAPKASPSILEGVPEGRGSNIGDWPSGHPCEIKYSPCTIPPVYWRNPNKTGPTFLSFET